MVVKNRRISYTSGCEGQAGGATVSNHGCEGLTVVTSVRRNGCEVHRFQHCAQEALKRTVMCGKCAKLFV